MTTRTAVRLGHCAFLGLIVLSGCRPSAQTVVAATPRQVAGLSLSLRGPQEVRLGEPLDLRIGFSNASSAPLVLYRGIGIGSSEELQLSAEGGGCNFKVPETHIEAPAEWAPFFFVPLVPGRGFEESLRLNDVSGSFIELPVHVPGIYHVTATLIGSDRQSAHGPLWIGSAESPALHVAVQPARRESLESWRRALDSCIRGDCSQLEGATKYFSLVRDEIAADLLIRLLPEKGSVARAVAAQGRKQDASALRLHGTRHVIPAAREYYSRAADMIERGDPCR